MEDVFVVDGVVFLGVGFAADISCFGSSEFVCDFLTVAFGCGVANVVFPGVVVDGCAAGASCFAFVGVFFGVGLLTVTSMGVICGEFSIDFGSDGGGIMSWVTWNDVS